MSFHASWEYGPFISLVLGRGRIWPSTQWQHKPEHKADTWLEPNSHSLSKHIPLPIYCFPLPVDSGRLIQKVTSPRSEAGTVVTTLSLRLMTVMDRFWLQILQNHLSNNFQLDKSGWNLALCAQELFMYLDFQCLCTFLSKGRWTRGCIPPISCEICVQGSGDMNCPVLVLKKNVKSWKRIVIL